MKLTFEDHTTTEALWAEAIHPWTVIPQIGWSIIKDSHVYTVTKIMVDYDAKEVLVAIAKR